MTRHQGKQLAAIATPEVGGVTIHRHPLEVETEKLMHLVMKVGRRLRFWIRKLPEQRQALIRIEDQWIPLRDKDGNPVMLHCLPDAEFRETAEWYAKAITNLLKEQRERAKMAGGKGGPPLTDEEYAAELADLRRMAVLEMPADELRDLLAMRPIDVESEAAPEGAPIAEDETI